MPARWTSMLLEKLLSAELLNRREIVTKTKI